MDPSSISPLGGELHSEDPFKLFAVDRGSTHHHEAFKQGGARLPVSLYSDCPQGATVACPVAASHLCATECLLHSHRRQGSTKLSRDGSAAGALPPKCLPFQPQRDRDVRGLLPVTSRYTLHEGPRAFHGGLEKGDQSMRTGLPRDEQPGAGALHAEQRVARQEHDPRGQAAGKHETQDTTSAQGNHRVPRETQREGPDQESSTTTYANILWHSLLRSHKKLCELCPGKPRGPRPVGMVQRHLQSRRALLGNAESSKRYLSFMPDKYIPIVIDILQSGNMW